MRAVCPWALPCKTSSFRKDHRPGLCPRPCGTSPCPWICPQTSSALGSFLCILPTLSISFLCESGNKEQVGRQSCSPKLCLQKEVQQSVLPAGDPGNAEFSACTELVKPPEPECPWLSLLKPVLMPCQASLRWHHLLPNENKK